MCHCIDEASKFIALSPDVLIDPLPHNRNMDSTNMDAGNTFGGHQNPSNAEGGHDCINMMSTTNAMTRKKYYDSSQPHLGKEPTPPKKPLHINNPEDIPCILKGVLK